MIGEDKASGLKILVAGEQNGVEHGLVQQEVAHPLRDDDVELLDGEHSFFEFALDEGDD